MSFIRVSAIMAHVNYALPLLMALTGKGGTFQRMQAFGKQSVLKRLESGASRKDLFYHLVRQHIESNMFTSLSSIIERRRAA
jgi:hypothetical protein